MAGEKRGYIPPGAEGWRAKGDSGSNGSNGAGHENGGGGGLADKMHQRLVKHITINGRANYGRLRSVGNGGVDSSVNTPRRR